MTSGTSVVASASVDNCRNPLRSENAVSKSGSSQRSIRLKTLSLGITVPDKFYELVRDNKEMYLFSPYDVEREYGTPFSYVDISKEYDNMVANKNIRKKKLMARELETEIGKLQQESGYPYIINIDTANRANPIDGRIDHASAVQQPRYRCGLHRPAPASCEIRQLVRPSRQSAYRP